MAQLTIPAKSYSALQEVADQFTSCAANIFQEIQQQQILQNIIDRIRACQTLDSIVLTITTEIRQLFKAERVAIFQFHEKSGSDSGKFIAENKQGHRPSVLQDFPCQESFASSYKQGIIEAIFDILEAPIPEPYLSILKKLQVRSQLVVPIHQPDELWGFICIHFCDQEHQWQVSEIETAETIAQQCAIALQHVAQFTQIRNHATLFARLNAQEKALQRQKSLVKISNRIRQYFDFQSICNTATQEAHNLLKCSRVAIYQFHPDWSGEFKFESYGQEWKALVGGIPNVNDTHVMQTQGEQFKHNQSVIVPDIYTANYPPCYIQLLETFQARGYTIVPIFQRQSLWGLLAAFQNDAPRIWEADEVELLTQIGEQLGIALGQAQSFQKIKEQSNTLQETYEQLKLSQNELIEKAKMAALGQLVAGVAHEINNPLGAIQASASNTQDALKQTIAALPKIQHILSPQQQEQLFELINRAIDSEPLIASSQRRAIKRNLIQVLKTHGIQEARGMADLLLDIGVYENLDPLMPLLESPSGPWALNFAYNLTSTHINNSTILQAVDRSSKIVFALKNYAHQDQNTPPQWCDICAGINTTLRIYHNQLKRNIQIIQDHDPSLPPIKGYPDELIQIWTNLVHNALQAMEDGGILSIQTQIENNGILVSIEDNGAGIPLEIQDQIFNAFFTTKPMGVGSGLGLYICQKIITKHHGQMTVQSEPGKTRFSVWLPIDGSRGEQDV